MKFDGVSLGFLWARAYVECTFSVASAAAWVIACGWVNSQSLSTLLNPYPIKISAVSQNKTRETSVKHRFLQSAKTDRMANEKRNHFWLINPKIGESLLPPGRWRVARASITGTRTCSRCRWWGGAEARPVSFCGDQMQESNIFHSVNVPVCSWGGKCGLAISVEFIAFTRLRVF